MGFEMRGLLCVICVRDMSPQKIRLHQNWFSFYTKLMSLFRRRQQTSLRAGRARLHFWGLGKSFGAEPRTQVNKVSFHFPQKSLVNFSVVDNVRNVRFSEIIKYFFVDFGGSLRLEFYSERFFQTHHTDNFLHSAKICFKETLLTFQ